MTTERRDPLDAFARRLAGKWSRDRSLPLSARVGKVASYSFDVARARLYLRHADELPLDVRVVGRPLIENKGKLIFGPRCVLRSIVAPVQLTVGPAGTMTFGADTHINSGTTMCAVDHVELGERVEVGPHVTIYDTNFHDLYDRNAYPEPGPVVIEDDVWLCTRCTVLPGVRIGRGSVVAAHALVVHDVEAFTVVSGVPAQPIKKLDPARFVVNPWK
jgi:acetyltransferase-like isoleucine patch superfamily enzyme